MDLAAASSASVRQVEVLELGVVELQARVEMSKVQARGFSRTRSDTPS